MHISQPANFAQSLSNPGNSQALNILKACLLHLFILSLAFLGWRLISGETLIPSIKQLSSWDVKWYSSIVEKGYQFVAKSQSNVAFFPMFPYLWKWLGLNAYGAALLNILFFYTGFFFLAYLNRFTFKLAMLFLSVPSLMFMYVPYTEALFFLFSTFLLAALHKNNVWATCLFLVICSLIRPVATVFLPALIIMELLTSGSQKNSSTALNLIAYTLSIVIGLGSVMGIQYLQTGTAFGFIEAQKYWDHTFRLPQFPLTSWGSTRLIQQMDGVAILLGMVAGFNLWKLFVKRVKGEELPEQNKAVIFSTLYLTGIALVILFFQGGSLQSLNRYFFATAFFVVFAISFLKNNPLKVQQLKWLFIFLTLFWLVFGSYAHVKVLLKFLALTAYLLLYLLLLVERKNIGNIAWLLIYIINIIAQVFVLQIFLRAEWVG